MLLLLLLVVVLTLRLLWHCECCCCEWCSVVHWWCHSVDTGETAANSAAAAAGLLDPAANNDSDEVVDESSAGSIVQVRDGATGRGVVSVAQPRTEQAGASRVREWWWAVCVSRLLLMLLFRGLDCRLYSAILRVVIRQLFLSHLDSHTSLSPPPLITANDTVIMDMYSHTISTIMFRGCSRSGVETMLCSSKTAAH